MPSTRATNDGSIETGQSQWTTRPRTSAPPNRAGGNTTTPGESGLLGT